MVVSNSQFAHLLVALKAAACGGSVSHVPIHYSPPVQVLHDSEMHSPLCVYSWSPEDGSCNANVPLC